MILLIQSEILALTTFVKILGRPTGQFFEPQDVSPITVALPSIFLIKPPKLFKKNYSTLDAIAHR